MKNNIKKVKKIKYIFILLILSVIIFFLGFNLGLHWHGFLYEKIYPKKLTCLGHNNFWETFQIECLFPFNKKQKTFIFSNKLKCNILTNHQFNNYLENKNNLKKSIEYGNITLIKADYRDFILNFDYKNNEIIRSKDPGEPNKDPYVIIQNDDKVINAIRKNKLDNFFGYEYQYLTISKKTGKGAIIWLNSEDFNQNKDNINTEFFQCESFK